MNQVGWDVVVLLVIVLVGGFFSGAEMALVSLREGQVHSLAQRGKRGQRVARLVSDPNRFLSAVQIGVTVATLLSGAYGAATLATALKSELIRHHVSTGLASALSLIIVTAVISFFSLVLQELAPKRLALQRPESLALVAAPILDRISSLARPLVWLLSKSTNVVVRLLGGDPSAGREAMTAEELYDLVAGHQALSADERRIVADVFDAGKRQLREVLLPRTEVEFIAADTPLARAAEIAAGASHSRFPVYQESYDDVIGFVHLRDLLNPGLAGKELLVGDLCRLVERLPISKRVLGSYTSCRRCAGTGRRTWRSWWTRTAGPRASRPWRTWSKTWSGTSGTYTTPRKAALAGCTAARCKWMACSTWTSSPSIPASPCRKAPIETVAAYVLSALGRLPAVGDPVEVAGRRLTVTEMDARRIARVRVGPPSADGAAAPSGPAGPAATATEEAARATPPT